MPRAVLKNGVICPVEPLPTDWQDGTELRIEKLSTPSNGTGVSSTDQWMNEVESLAAKIPQGEDDKLMTAIKQIRRDAKDLARKGKR